MAPMPDILGRPGLGTALRKAARHPAFVDVAAASRWGPFLALPGRPLHSFGLRVAEAVRGVVADPAVRRAVLVVAALRLGLGLVGWLGLVVVPATGRNAVLHDLLIPPGSLRWALLGPWQRDDALWYQQIATHGYSRGGPDDAFLPLYPGLVRATSVVLGGDAVAAGLVVSSLALVVALVLLQRLVGEDLGDAVGWRTTLLLALCPSAFFLVAPYSEALFLALSVATFLAARQRRFVLAGLLAALATLTRIQGLALLAPLLWEIGVEVRSRGGWRDVRPAHVVALGAPIVVVAAVVASWGVFLGEAAGPFGAIAHWWGSRIVPPWTALGDSLAVIPSHGEEALNWAAAVALLASLPTAWRRMPKSYALYTAASAAAIVLHEQRFTPLMSASRYALVVFPFFAVLALATERRPRWRLALAILFVLGMGVRFVEVTHFRLVA